MLWLGINAKRAQGRAKRDCVHDMAAVIETEPARPTRPVGEILLRGFHMIAVLGAFLFGFAAYWLGFLFNFLFLLLIVLLAATSCSRVAGAVCRTLEFHFVRRPFERLYRSYLLQCLNRWAFLLLTAVVLRLAIVPAQFAPGEYGWLQAIVWGTTLLLMLFALFPQKRVRISTNIFFAMGWLYLGTELLRIFLPPAASLTVVLEPPFRGEWYIVQGGRSALINHHYPIAAQRYALDIMKTIAGREVQRNDKLLESYPAYGQVLYAPADGKVAKVVNDRPDMPVGSTDQEQIVGNHVVLDIGRGRFVLMAHLKRGSIRVAPGENVRCGQVVAECGNSGNTSAPHLHLQVQNHADFDSADLRTFPILFHDVLRVRFGRREVLEKADVRCNDVVGKAEHPTDGTEKSGPNPEANRLSTAGSQEHPSVP